MTGYLIVSALIGAVIGAMAVWPSVRPRITTNDTPEEGDEQ
ncbi:hypothetical protein OG393_30795 [Streptomyces sp. NBC_01216]|nr:hypothetical protein OG393_30795 [Streptomyces sp. NBC_01216]